ncbi:MAG TPA: 4Fe-4S binding protein [Deltaproteobacteria bacterium]|nr:4Fe-4S binding protein [Deltaproteobacteria bacterium]
MNKIQVHVSADLCSGCGLCLTVCPNDIFTLHRNKAIVTGGRCLGCEHCRAVCPAAAISISGIDPELILQTITTDNRWLPYGQTDPAQLVRLMRSRRSCRNFKKNPVSREQLEDLVKIGTTAPSGTNSQGWTFTILPTRQAVVTLGDQISGYFKKLNRLAATPGLRQLLRFIGKPALDNYFRRYYQTIDKGLRQWEEENRDRLFHGATAAIIIGSKPGASCPMEDAMLASQNILLAAHAMGLGTCLIGFAVAAMAKDAKIKTAIGIPQQEPIYSVIALGYPAEPYQRLTGRKKVEPRYFTGQDR